jgi:type IV pilus assembly protein PilA
MDAKTRGSAGFTLIEMMIVVAILGILAAVAIVAYNKYVERSHNAEATGILADIRLKQEAYRATFHQYANLKDASWVPDTSPGISPRNWPTDKTQWNQLGVRPDNGVYFSYYGESGLPGDAPTGFSDELLPASITDNDFWYGAEALQDLNGDGKCAGFLIVTGTMQIQEVKDGACPS